MSQRNFGAFLSAMNQFFQRLKQRKLAQWVIALAKTDALVQEVLGSKP